jgi:lactoylglutathione lyase
MTLDIEDSINFYSEIVGLEVAIRFSPQPKLKIVFLKDTDGSRIELIQNDDISQISEKDGISICFECDSMDKTLEFVKSKDIPVVAGPFKNPAVKYFHVKDPNGVTVQFLERLK